MDANGVGRFVAQTHSKRLEDLRQEDPADRVHTSEACRRRLLGSSTRNGRASCGRRTLTRAPRKREANSASRPRET
eukprot:8256506-Alexandrium_andersonii.AAC.1